MGRQAVILCGGFGTRLSHVVSDVPKPMAPVKNIPFLEYIVKQLQGQGFDDFVFLTGYKSEIIENYFKNLKNAKFIKEETALGTGGAILNAFASLNGDFYVINGDTFFDIDFSLLEDFGNGKSCTVALRYSNDVERYGFVDIDDNFHVTDFIEKGKLPQNRIDGFINGGIYYITKSCLNSFVKSFNGQFISLETEIFPQFIKDDELFGLPVGGCFIDIGIPDDYYKAQTLIPDWIAKEAKPALFIDKDGTLIENTEYPHGKDFKIIESTVEIVKQHFDKNYYVVMVTNQAGIAKDKFSFEQMYEGFEGIKDFYKSKRVEFDDIEFCPYHKDGIIKEYSYDSILRKPNSGMILKACEKLKIDLKNSLMVGDNTEIDNIKLPYLKCEILTEKERSFV